jgi:hypothetical protein
MRMFTQRCLNPARVPHTPGSIGEFPEEAMIELAHRLLTLEETNHRLERTICELLRRNEDLRQQNCGQPVVDFSR